MSLAQWNPREIERILDEAGPVALMPPITDRTTWEAMAAHAGADRVAAVIKKAEGLMDEPIPTLTASLWLDFQRTGNRADWERVHGARSAMLTTFVLAEALENKGRFLDKCLDMIWARLEESSWALPAHQSRLTDRDEPIVDLGAVMTAIDLAEFDAVMGPVMDPLLGKRIRDEVNERVLVPYMARHDYNWMFNAGGGQVNNWNAVCNCGCMAAAMYLQLDNARTAEVLARGLRSLDDYLLGFDPDGGSTEGPGYWEYGFGHYVVIGDLVERRTRGAIPMLHTDQVRNVAQFPMRTRLAGNEYATFSDCDTHVELNRPLVAFLSRRLQLPRLMALANCEAYDHRWGSLVWALREFLWASDPTDEPLVLDERNWFGGMAWMIARLDPADPDAMVLACKGGHNGEMHNQNDVGSFIVTVGGESIIRDPGRGRYTREYFGEKRYSFWICTSKSHSVPLVNGVDQSINQADMERFLGQIEHDDPGKDMARAAEGKRKMAPRRANMGAQFAADVVEHIETSCEDRLTIDMTNVYGENADLELLQRSTALLRKVPGGRVTVTDTYRFKGGAHPFENAIITLVQPELTDDAVVLRGEKAALRITWQGAKEVVIEPHKDVDMYDGLRDVYRIAFRAPLQKEGEIKLSVERA